VDGYPDYLPYFNEAVRRTRSAVFGRLDLDWARIAPPGAACCAAADSAAAPRVPRHGGPDPRAVAAVREPRGAPADERWVAISALARTRDLRLRWLECLPSRGSRIGKSIDLYYIP